MSDWQQDTQPIISEKNQPETQAIQTKQSGMVHLYSTPATEYFTAMKHSE